MTGPDAANGDGHGPVPGGPPALPEQHLPPVAQLGVATLILVVTGGVYLSARIGKSVPWALPITLLVVAAVLFAVNLIVFFTRVHRDEFAFEVFWRVAGWAFLAYLVIGGMLEYVFIHDHMRGTMLAVITCMLVLFITDVPLIISFTVARYQQVSKEPAPAVPTAA